MSVAGDPVPMWAKDLQQRHTLTKRGGGRPNVHVFVSKGPSFKSDAQKLKEHMATVFQLLDGTEVFLDFSDLNEQLERI